MVSFFECLIVYISLDLKTKSLVQEAIGKTAKIETEVVAEFRTIC